MNRTTTRRYSTMLEYHDPKGMAIPPRPVPMDESKMVLPPAYSGPRPERADWTDEAVAEIEL